MGVIETRATVRGKRMKLRLPGGWMAKVPEVEAIAADERIYTRYFQAHHSLPPAKAKAEARRMIQKVQESGYLRKLADGMRYWMEKYARQWPEKVREDGTLEGFDPAVMQNACVPFENVGRRGKPHAERLMREMANAQN